MYITLPFVRLGDEEVGDVPTDSILITHRIASEYLLQPASISVGNNERKSSCTLTFLR